MRTLRARTRFQARMRGRSTREHDFRRGCEDALRESAIFSENVRTLHAKTRFQARMRGRSTRERAFRRECEDAPRESAIFSENARTLHAKTRIPARMRGRSTRERAFRRECEDASHARARFPTRIFAGRQPCTSDRRFYRSGYYFTILLFFSFNRDGAHQQNARTLHARARFPARMRGRSTRERDFRRECEDAPRESAISGENARTLHARARF